jgi:phage gpG-like protein
MTDDILKVTLLGTGIPNPSIHAFGTATLIEAGGQIAVVTARDAFTLDQDALPGLRCR